MALKLWTGPSGSGKTRFLFEYVLDEAEKHPELNYIVIVPEQFTLSTQKELIRLSKNHGILNVDVLSFARLAYKIFEEVGFKDARGVPIDDMGKNLIIRHLAAKCEDKLRVFNGKMDKLGYITEVKSAISEFMQYGITVDRLSEMIEIAKESGRGQLAAKLSDMQILYKEFNTYIDQKYITKEEMLTKARRAAYKSQKLKRSVVVFDGFTGFTPVQYNFMESLLQISRDIHVTILMDTRDNITYNTQHELFYLGYKTSQKLEKLAELNNIPVSKRFEIKENVPRRFIVKNELKNESEVSSEMLVHLERNLFREHAKCYLSENSITEDSKLPTKVVDDEIRVFSALQPIDEVRKVAIEIQKLVRNDNENVDKDKESAVVGETNFNDNSCVRYKNIAIATGNLEEYAPLFKRVFKEYDIPYFIDKTFPVLMNPFIEYIRALLDVFSENFTYFAVFRYLRSPLNDFKTDDIDRLENFVLKYGVKGINTWKTSWTEKYRRYSKNKSENIEIEPDDELISVDLLRQKVVEDLKDFIDLITEGKKRRVKKPTKAVNEINAVFIRVFEEKKIENRIDELYNQYSITDETFAEEHQKEYKNIYALVLELFNRMSELLKDEIISYEEYAELLDAGFDEIRIGVIPTITDYIQIGDVTRSRFENLHMLFIVGVNDGVIPGSSSSGGIISDIEKEFLIEYTPDIELSPTVREQAFTGQLYLYMLMTKPKNGLRISYSRLGNDSESLRPSYIIKVLLDMFPNMHVEKDCEIATDYIFNLNSLFTILSGNLRSSEYEDLISMLVSDPVYGSKFKSSLLKACNATYMTGVFNGKDTISKVVASVLYGKQIVGSVTKLEQYARCSLSYFLKYGLSLKEREVYSFEARDLGTIFHGVLEKYSKYVNAEGTTWTDVSLEHAKELINKAIESCIDDPRYSVLQSSFRHKYMIERIARICLRSVNILTDHLNAGVFNPKGVEISFSSSNSLDSLTFKLSEDEVMKFTGSIDRLDIHKDTENEDKVYIKIIDYKSREMSLDLVEVYKGLSLQLVVYMNAAKEIVAKESANKNVDVVPAGILYYHIDDPIVDGDIHENDDDISVKILKSLKMKGLVNADENVYRLLDKDFDKKSDIIPIEITSKGELSKRSSAVTTEDFDTISKYVNKKIESIGMEILSGNIKAEPHSAAGISTDACKYCPYVDICKYYGENVEDAKIEDVLEEMRRCVSN